MLIGLGLATLIGAGLSFAGGLAGNLINQNVAQENIAAQKTANQENIAFQKAENDITREREDNAVQRAAADMTAAGLSKTLAAGQPASAASLTAPHTQAVQNQFKYESALQKMNIAGLVQDMAVKQKQLDMEEAKNDAEIGYINAQTVGQNNTNETFMKTWENEQLLNLAKTAQANSVARLNEIEADLNEKLAPYKVDQIMKDIDLKVSQINLNEKSIEKASKEISKLIAEEEHLDAQTELLVEQAVTERLKQAGWTHDLGYAGTNGLPVGAMPSGLAGSIVTAGQSLGGMAYNGLVKPFVSGLKGLWDYGKGLFGFGD